MRLPSASKYVSLQRKQSIFSRTRRHVAIAFALTLVLAVVTTSALALSFILKWGTTGTANGQFLIPNGVAVDSAGNVYVSEGNGNRGQKFTSSGGFLMAFGIPGDVPGGFVTPSGIAVDSLGNIYMTDSTTNRVSKFNSSGTFVTTWGTTGSGPGQFLSATGVAVDSANNVYTTDGNNHRVQKFTSSGVLLTSWGSSGSADGQFSGPQGLGIDSADNVYVADTGNNRIQKFSSTGTFLTKWGTAGNGNGQFANPQGVSADTSGNIYVADSGNDRIQKFSNTGTFIEAFGSTGSGDGQFSLPQDVAADAVGNVYVADSAQDRIQKLSTVATPLVANAGPDQTVECAGALTPITLDGTASTGSGTLSYEWKEGVTTLGTGATLATSLVAGSHTIKLTVTSSGGGSADDTVSINIVDTTAPTISLNGVNPMTVECHTSFTDPGATASDVCAGDLTGVITASGSVNPNAVGTYTLTYSVSDGSHTTTTTRTVNVVDTTAPVITLNGSSPSLWPPNHKYHTFNVTDFVTSVTDSCATSLGVGAVVISQVTSDEADNSNAGDGNTVNDMVISSDCRSVQLRAERNGSGNGRVYTITFKVSDGSGNSTTATAKVTVPKSQEGGFAVDDGPQNTVLGSCP